MMMRFRRLAVSAIAAWIWPHMLAAQTPLPQGPAPMQFGPLSLYPTINIQDAGTDSNVFNDAADPKDDFTFTVNPRLLAGLRLGSTQLTVLSSEDFVYFRKYKDQQSVNVELGARFDVTMSRLRPFVSAQRVGTRKRPNLEIDARARRTEQSMTAGLDFDLSAITAVTVSARQDEPSFAEGERFRGVLLADALNRTSRSVSGGLKFVLTPFTTLVMAAEIQQDRFSRSHLRDSDSLRFAPSLEFSSQAAITGRAAAGYRRFEPVDPALPAYRGFVAAVGVVYKLLGVTTFDVQANRDVVYSFEEAEPYYLGTGGRVAITQRLFGPLEIIASGQRDRLDYRSVQTSSLTGRVDTVDVVGGGFGVRVGRNVRVAFTGERAVRRSTDPGEREYQRTRLLGSLTLGS